MALISMTGFGRGSAVLEALTVNVELKGVNNRFVDVVCKLPSFYASVASTVEQEISKRVRDVAKRGRVEVFMTRVVAGVSGAVSELKLNEAALLARIAIAKKACSVSGIKEDVVLGQVMASLLSRTDVVESSGAAMETVTKAETDLLYQALDAALKEFSSMRVTEGLRLTQEMEQYLVELVQATALIKSRTATLPEQFKLRLQERLKRLNGGTDVDEARLAQEVAILADRIEISEELTRLDSHFSQAQLMIKDPSSGGGRKLEFIFQEMLREVNTIGSKSQDGEVTRLVVDMKTGLEKLREQVQNVE